MSKDKIKKRVVLVTGFGPFEGHPTNASWEAVKELRKKFEIEEDSNIALVTEEVPVVYESVSTVVPQLWSDHDPMLVVHVGVSASARCLTLESRAHKTGYKKLDVGKKCPLEIAEDGMDGGSNCGIISVMETGMDVKKICHNINKCTSSGSKDEGCRAVVSNDAGRYLCEYIFRQSLSIHPRKTLFVHVPDLGTYSAAKTAEGLYDVIRFAIEMIEETKN